MRRFVSVLLLLVPLVVGADVPSGLPVGEYVLAWNPIHVAGPDKGTNTCPICTYLERPMVQVFVKDGPQVGALAERVERLVATYEKKEFKGFVIVTDGVPEKLARLGAERKITKSALCYPDPSTKKADLNKYHINPAAQNTIIVYREYKVTAVFVNLNETDFAKVEEAVKKSLP
jgi:protocatechuate 3,4-dioxygenase beta subunit